MKLPKSLIVGVILGIAVTVASASLFAEGSQSCGDNAAFYSTFNGHLRSGSYLTKPTNGPDCTGGGGTETLGMIIPLGTRSTGALPGGNPVDWSIPWILFSIGLTTLFVMGLSWLIQLLWRFASPEKSKKPVSAK